MSFNLIAFLIGVLAYYGIKEWGKPMLKALKDLFVKRRKVKNVEPTPMQKVDIPIRDFKFKAEFPRQTLDLETYKELCLVDAGLGQLINTPIFNMIEWYIEGNDKGGTYVLGILRVADCGNTGNPDLFFEATKEEI